jgi:type I restriction enzyme M protein
MAIVLPQGRFNNIMDEYVREYIMEKARILAVVSLGDNTFRPHAGTKTSVLFLQKWDDKLCPKKEDYPIFLAISEKSGKASSGEYVFKKNELGEPEIDKHGHLIVEHDLDKIAENFIEFAKKEELSFWKT